MKNLCRLCAKERTSRQLMYNIDDINLNIEQKLIVCCRWNSFIGNEQMPKMICAICWKSLEKSFDFAESVALAQQQLFTQLIEIKVEVGLLEPINEPIESINILIAKDEPLDSDAFNEFPNNIYEPISTEQHFSAPAIENGICADGVENKNINSYMRNNEWRSQHQSNHHQEYSNYEQQIKQQESEINNFLCETCGKDYTTRSNLLTHTKMHLPIEKRKHFECYICQSTFSYKKSLIHHMPVHSGKKIQFQCKECMANFSRTDALRRHSLIHLNKFTHCCQTCGKGFRTKFNLKVNKKFFE